MLGRHSIERQARLQVLAETGGSTFLGYDQIDKVRFSQSSEQGRSLRHPPPPVAVIVELDPALQCFCAAKHLRCLASVPFAGRAGACELESFLRSAYCTPGLLQAPEEKARGITIATAHGANPPYLSDVPC